MTSVPSDSAKPTTSLLVHPDHLDTNWDNGLHRPHWLHNLNPFRGHQHVTVEALPHFTKDSLFYAPFHITQQQRSLTPTQFATVSSHTTDHLVHQGDEFEISFVGMSITPQDIEPNCKNELLLYSITNDLDEDDKKEDRETYKQDEIVPSTMIQTNTSSKYDPSNSTTLTQSNLPPQPLTKESIKQIKSSSSSFLASLSANLPYIHYDPVFDAPVQGDTPNTYISLPASKSLYRRISSADEKTNKVFIRFRVMEIDANAEALLQAMSQVQDLSAVFRSTGIVGIPIPHMQAVSSALQIATNIGKRSLKQYSKPDHVMSKDMEFKIVGGKDENNVDHDGDQLNCYLRYGYYFFLSKKIDAKLYTQTGCSSQNVPLFMHRVRNETEKKEGCSEYFPLTDVSYVVVKVTKGCEKNRPAEWDQIRRMHKRRLARMLTMNEMKDLLLSGQK